MSVLPPTLLFRTAICVEFTKKATGQSVAKIEERVRLNQFEKFGLRPPATETVRDYFKLRRNIAFDPQVKRPTSPSWLFALDREVPGAAYHYFHPLIDLIWGVQESGIFWRNQVQKIPEAWIEDEERKGNMDLAEDWRKHNSEMGMRRQRAIKEAWLDRLSTIHQSLLRIPSLGEGLLFHRPGLAQGWIRKYGRIEMELEGLSEGSDLNHLAALIGLMLEAAEIGHSERFISAKSAALEALARVGNMPECRRIGSGLKAKIGDFLSTQQRRSYTSSPRYGFGWPASWRLQLQE